MLGTYCRDTRNENGERLLAFAFNHGLAMVKTIFSTPKTASRNVQRGRQQEMRRLHLQVTARQKRRVERCCAPSTVVSHHVGPQHHGGPCENVRPARWQPPGKKGYNPPPLNWWTLTTDSQPRRKWRQKTESERQRRR